MTRAGGMETQTQDGVHKLRHPIGSPDHISLVLGIQIKIRRLQHLYTPPAVSTFINNPVPALAPKTNETSTNRRCPSPASHHTSPPASWAPAKQIPPRLKYTYPSNHQLSAGGNAHPEDIRAVYKPRRRRHPLLPTRSRCVR